MPLVRKGRRSVSHGSGHSPRQDEPNDQHQDDQRGIHEHATLRTRAPARQPSRTVDGRPHQGSVQHAAAVRDSEEEALGVVPGSVKTDREPQGAGAAERVGKNEPDQGRSE